MQAISVSEARANFKKYCDDVTKKKDTIIVCKNGNGKNNIVWIDLNEYNELKKAKENLEYLKKIEKSLNQIEDGDVVVKTLEEMEEMSNGL